MDLRNMKDEELKEMLKKLREDRKASYTSRKKSSSKKEEMISPLQGLDENVAMKILDELLSGS